MTSERMDGFSLLECLVAVIILGLSIMIGIELMGAQASQEYDAVNSLKAETILGRHFEIVRASKFASLETTDFNPDSKHSDFQARRVVSNVNSSLKEILIEVRWIGSTDHAVTKSIVTFRSQASE
ncbi:MAG: prepilin-type N-terminal cleavage/methylation domain-containing protein [Planctomycetota bacterium]